MLEDDRPTGILFEKHESGRPAVLGFAASCPRTVAATVRPGMVLSKIAGERCKYIGRDRALERRRALEKRRASSSGVCSGDTGFGSATAAEVRRVVGRRLQPRLDVLMPPPGTRAHRCRPRQHGALASTTPRSIRRRGATPESPAAAQALRVGRPASRGGTS